MPDIRRETKRGRGDTVSYLLSDKKNVMVSPGKTAIKAVNSVEIGSSDIGLLEEALEYSDEEESELDMAEIDRLEKAIIHLTQSHEKTNKDLAELARQQAGTNKALSKLAATLEGLGERQEQQHAELGKKLGALTDNTGELTKLYTAINDRTAIIAAQVEKAIPSKK